MTDFRHLYVRASFKSEAGFDTWGGQFSAGAGAGESRDRAGPRRSDPGAPVSGEAPEPMPATPADARQVSDLSARYADAVRRYFSRRLAGAPDIEDLTQEVFVRLLRRARLGDIENIEGYLFQIAANLMRERGRHRLRRRLDAQQPFDDDFSETYDDVSPERILLGREAYDLMVRSLQELPERTRTVFILNRFEDLTGVEIARRLGVSVSTVEKDMMRAIAHLRMRLR